MSKINMFSLGGLNENGKNMYVVEVDEDIFVFEAGLQYADEHVLGIDYAIPNINYLKDNKERIKGIFLTHGHDENVGAVADIIDSLPDVKIYASKFTYNIVYQELVESKKKTDNLIMPEFSSSVKEYTLTVPNEITEVSVAGTTKDSKATYSVEGNKELQVGENEVKVIVKAEDGTTTTYKIIVPPMIEGTIKSIVYDGDYTIVEDIAEIETEDEVKKIQLHQLQ